MTQRLCSLPRMFSRLLFSSVVALRILRKLSPSESILRRLVISSRFPRRDNYYHRSQRTIRRAKKCLHCASILNHRARRVTLQNQMSFEVSAVTLASARVVNTKNRKNQASSPSSQSMTLYLPLFRPFKPSRSSLSFERRNFVTLFAASHAVRFFLANIPATSPISIQQRHYTLYARFNAAR